MSDPDESTVFNPNSGEEVDEWREAPPRETTWKLVEAAPSEGTAGGGSIRRGSGKKPTRRKSSGNRPEYTVEVPTAEDVEYHSHVAASAIESMFNVDYLCQDSYLRSFMDREGWLPIAFVYSYPAVSLTCCNGYADHNVILDKLAANESFDVNKTFETIRLRSNWRQWLVPNAEGGFGRSLLYHEEQQLLSASHLQEAAATAAATAEFGKNA